MQALLHFGSANYQATVFVNGITLALTLTLTLTLVFILVFILEHLTLTLTRTDWKGVEVMKHHGGSLPFQVVKSAIFSFSHLVFLVTLTLTF
jgi:hypothetical protein